MNFDWFSANRKHCTEPFALSCAAINGAHSDLFVHSAQHLKALTVSPFVAYSRTNVTFIMTLYSAIRLPST